MDRRFAESFLHCRHRICGRRLLPFCAAYQAALEAVGNPLVSDDPAAIIRGPDLLHALEVCSHPIDPLTLTPRGAMAPRLLPLDPWRLLRYRFSRSRFERGLRRWQAYLADYNSFPQMTQPLDPESRAGSRAITGPAPLARVCSVLKQYGGAITALQAWTLPYGFLAWIDEQGRELDGGGREFWSEEREAQVDAALAQAKATGERLLAERRAREE